MKKEDQEIEEFEKLLKASAKPMRADWSSNRVVLEKFLLEDAEKVRSSRRTQWLRSVSFGSLGLAATIILSALFFLQKDPDSNAHTGNQLSPIQFANQAQPTTEIAKTPMEYRALESTNKLTGVRDLGWVETDGSGLKRKYKYEYMDTVDLLNERDGSIMRVQVPREEIVHVSYQAI